MKEWVGLRYTLEYTFNRSENVCVDLRRIARFGAQITQIRECGEHLIKDCSWLPAGLRISANSNTIGECGEHLIQGRFKPVGRPMRHTLG
jgi:hypothetical protein